MANEKLEWQNKKDEKNEMKSRTPCRSDNLWSATKGVKKFFKAVSRGTKSLRVVGLAQFSTHKSRTFSYFAGKKDHKSLLPYARLVLPLEVTEKKEKISLFRIQISEARHPPEGLTVSMTSEKPENHENVVDEYTRKEERTILDKYRRSHLHSPAKQIECPLSCLPTYCCSSMQQL